jgi:peptidoglycan/LPS O-acetylase OafA/YrhL
MSRPRLYAVDWLRVLMMLAVFFAHVAHIFDFDPAGAVKNEQTSLGATFYMLFCIQWVLPLLFLLAGVSSWFSLRSRSDGHYVRERVARLGIPLIFGSVVLIPWNGYMSALNHGSYDGSFWSFLPVHVERTWAALTMPEVYHGLIALYYTSWHLWFLGYLLILSIVALPVCRRVPTAWFVRLCNRPAGLLALGMPLVLIRVVLGPAFPAYMDWADTMVWFVLLVYGWLFAADARCLRAVERQAPVWTAVGCLTFAGYVTTYVLGYLEPWAARSSYTADYLFYQLLLALNTWAWILAILGNGLRYLNFENAALRYAGEVVLPFYILHQILVYTVGETVVGWPLGVYGKALIIVVGAFAATMACYELAIRRIGVLRVLFGLRGRSKSRTAPVAVGDPAPMSIQ